MGKSEGNSCFDLACCGFPTLFAIASIVLALGYYAMYIR
jgi:hypothetical protein